MNDKINQNSDSFILESSWSESLKQRAEVQQNLKDQLQELKNLQKQVEQSSHVEKTDRNITDQLLSLEDKIQQMNAFKGKAFDLEVMKIQSQLNVLNISLNALADLEKQIHTSYSNLYEKIQNQLPEYNIEANWGRASAVGNLLAFVEKNDFMKDVIERASS